MGAKLLFYLQLLISLLTLVELINVYIKLKFYRPTIAHS